VYDVVVKSSRSLSHLVMSFLFTFIPSGGRDSMVKVFQWSWS